MALDLAGKGETSDERALRLRQATMRRIRILSVVCLMLILARVFIKNPPPPKPIDQSKTQIRYVPGMLDNMSASSMQKMDPVLLARLQKADMEHRRAKLMESQNLIQGTYKPAEAPIEDKTAEEEVKQLVYMYSKKREIREQEEKKREATDVTKPVLVQFARGGYLKVEKATANKRVCDIQFSPTLLASVPGRMVASISDNAMTWQPPVPAGKIRINPAKGITITVTNRTAKRISVRKTTYDET